MAATESASLLSKANSEALFLLLSNLSGIGIGVYVKYLHGKANADSDIVDKLTKENAALKEMMDPGPFINRLAVVEKEVGFAHQKIDHVIAKSGLGVSNNG